MLGVAERSLRVGALAVKINLTWWRKRPSVHVATTPEEELWALQNQRLDIIDMSNAIMMLDADRSHFTTMLEKISNPGYVQLTLDAPLAVGTFFDHDGFIHRVESCDREANDDWFAPDRWIVGARKPWVEKPVPAKTLFAWLEDDLMPRFHGRPYNPNAILTNITDTYSA